MRIQQRRVRSIKRAIGPLVPNTSFRVAIPVADVPVEGLTRTGFDMPPQAGDTVLPADVGPVTRYNAVGCYVVRKDLPKEKRYITTVEWSWEEWAGRYDTITRTEDRPIYRECYPQDSYPPPAAELTMVMYDGDMLIVSEELVKKPAQEERILHIINVYLELFGECEVRHADLKALTPPNLRKVNWSLLPPGKYPWSQVRQHVKQILEDTDDRFANPILNRQEKIALHNPDEVYVGRAGFRSYVAYVFNAKGIAVLESVMLDNATYVFDQNWQHLSQMTKAEILQGNLQRDRIIHNERWGDRIDKLLQ